jgi:hypothetical protein
MLHISHCYSYIRVTDISFLFNQTKVAETTDPCVLLVIVTLIQSLGNCLVIKSDDEEKVDKGVH